MADFTNVEVTDTFDQWRIKTNQLGSDFIAFESQTADDIANIDLSSKADTNHTHIISNVTNLQTELDNLGAEINTNTDNIDNCVTFTGGTGAVPETISGKKAFTTEVDFYDGIRVVGGSGYPNSGIEIIGTGSANKLTIESGKMKLRNQDYTWPSSYSAGRYLRTDSQGNLSWAEVAGGSGSVNLSTLVFNDIVPVGTIMPWAGTSLPSDGKWKFCDGAQVSNATYPDIAALLGTRYGSASSGKTKLPNFAGRVPLGAGALSAGGTFSVGQTGGASEARIHITGTTGSTILTPNQIPSHKHFIATSGSNNTGILSSTNQLEHYYSYQETGSTQTGNPNYEYILHGSTSAANRGLTSATGEGQGHSHTLNLQAAHSQLQPYLTTQYIIKVLPDDVQQVSINAGNGINVKNASNQDTTTLDLFSTKIELKADTSQFKFSSSGLLQLKTIQSGQIANKAISLDKIQDIGKGYVLGKGHGQSTGSPQEIYIDNNLSSVNSSHNTVVSAKAVKDYVDTAASGLATTDYVDTAATGAGKTIRASKSLELSGTTTTAGFIIVKVSSYQTGSLFNRTSHPGYANITADGNTYPVQVNGLDEKAIATIPIRAGATYSIAGKTVTATFIPLS